METQGNETNQQHQNALSMKLATSSRIRNIFFGSQMRDYDDRFQKLEERLSREAGELRSDLQRQLQALETFMRGEVESMTNRGMASPGIPSIRRVALKVVPRN